MSLYTGSYAPQQGMQPQAPQMAPQQPSYQQQLAQALQQPQQGTGTDMSSVMKMIQQFAQMQQQQPQPLASSAGMAQLPMTAAPAAQG